ncbi:hypothetical protein C8R44DRAFT_887232 [Mycena epipterygia]|nr:hypothetical protein C8R44DRAFT_887232 [Mycena epipterygia]
MQAVRDAPYAHSSPARRVPALLYTISSYPPPGPASAHLTSPAKRAALPPPPIDPRASVSFPPPRPRLPSFLPALPPALRHLSPGSGNCLPGTSSASSGSSTFFCRGAPNPNADNVRRSSVINSAPHTSQARTERDNILPSCKRCWQDRNADDERGCGAVPGNEVGKTQTERGGSLRVLGVYGDDAAVSAVSIFLPSSSTRYFLPASRAHLGSALAPAPHNAMSGTRFSSIVCRASAGSVSGASRLPPTQMCEPRPQRSSSCSAQPGSSCHVQPVSRAMRAPSSLP